jgi:hypothetical protein
MDEFSQFLMGGQSKPNPQTNPVATQSGSPLITDALLDSLKRTESGKQKFALNKESGAMGDYQFIPSTVKMLHEQGYEFNPFNPTQAREAAKHYLTGLVQKTGSLDKALAAYGGHITKDPTAYVNKVVGGAQQTAKTQTQESSDPFSSFLMGGKAESSAESKKEPLQQLKPKLFGQAEGMEDSNKTFMEKFAERSKKATERQKTELAPMASLADTAAGIVPGAVASVTYPIARAVGQTPEQATKIAQTVSEPLSQPFGKALGVTETPQYQGEFSRKAMETVAQYVGESAEAISKKTGIPKEDVENMLGTLGNAVGAKLPSAKNALKAQFEKSFPRFDEAPTTSPKQTMAGVGAAESNIQNRVQTALNDAPDYLKQSLKDTPVDKLATEENLKVIENHNKFAKFDLIPTEGQALQNASLMSNEFNARKTDPNLQARFEERDPKLIQGFNRIKEDLSPDVFENDPIRLASMPLDRMKNDYISEQANIRTLYDKANRAAGGSQAPIDIGALRENIINGLKEKQRTRYVPPRLQADLDEVLTQGFMTPEQYENFRTDTATIARTSKDPLESQAASIIREKLEQVPIKDEFAQYKPLYDEARKAVAALKQKEKNPAYKAAISDTRTLDEIEAGVPHPAANNFLANHYAAKTPQVNIERMLDLIGRNSPEHQALNKLKLDEFKLNSGIKNDSGTVNQAALNKIIYHQNQSNLPVMFGNQIAKDLQDLADVANLSEPRKGVHSVNVSNTEILRQENAARAAKETASNIAAGLTESAINMKVPFGGTILRSTFGGMKAEREAKAAAKAAQEESDKRLSPKAGIKLKDIGKE